MNAELEQAVIVKLVAAVLDAAKSVLGEERLVDAAFNAETNRVDVFLIFSVVSHPQHQYRELSLDQARQIDPSASEGGTTRVRLYYAPSDSALAHVQRKRMPFLTLPGEWKRFNQIAARVAKEVIRRSVEES
jgi:hypothetical protein